VYKKDKIENYVCVCPIYIGWAYCFTRYRTTIRLSINVQFHARDVYISPWVQISTYKRFRRFELVLNPLVNNYYNYKIKYK